MSAARTVPTARRAASTWLAWSCGAIGVALLLLRSAIDPSTSALGSRATLPSILFPLAFPVVGVLLASRRPRHPIGWLFLAVAIGWGVADTAGAYELSLSPDQPLASLAAWLRGWTTYIGIGALLFILLLFPDGHLPSVRWRPVAWLIAGYTVTAATLTALAPPAAATLQPLGLPFVAAVAAAGLSVVLRFVHATGLEQQQLKWLVAACLFVVAILGATAALEAMAPRPMAALGSVARLPLYVSVCSVPISVAIAILRYRLYDIDLLVNRTLVYGTMTLAVIAVYIAVVGYLGSLFRTGDELVVSLVATGVIAVLFQPLRERVQLSIDRLLYGRRHEPYAVLSGLGRRLEMTLASDAMIEAVVRTVRESLQLSYAAIALRIDGDTAVAAASGTPTTTPLRFPLTHQGELVGELLLSPRRGEELTSTDRRLLDDLARQAGVVVHAVRLTSQLRQANAHLRAAREQLVSAREEERRRLRRDLHDGLGPRLASLTLRLEAARDSLAREPEAAALLGDIAERTRAAIADIRRLVAALRPAALDDLGLVAALAEAAAEYERLGRLRIRVDGPGLPALPAAVEVAAYRIALEAMTNVVRHASADRCAVSLAIDASGQLLLDVQDDGCGISHGTSGGVGLSSMRERAGELGGSLSIEPSPGGGTRVTAVMPLRPPQTGAGQNAARAELVGTRE